MECFAFSYTLMVPCWEQGYQRLGKGLALLGANQPIGKRLAECLPMPAPKAGSVEGLLQQGPGGDGPTGPDAASKAVVLL